MLCTFIFLEEKSSKGVLRPAKSMDSLSAAAGAIDGEYRCEWLCVCAVTITMQACVSINVANCIQ